MLKVTLFSDGSATLQYSGRLSCLKLIARDIAHIRRQDVREQSPRNLGRCRKKLRCSQATTEIEGPQACISEQQLPGMSSFLDSLKWSRDGLVAVIVQVNGSVGFTAEISYRLSEWHLYVEDFVGLSPTARGHWRSAHAGICRPHSYLRNPSD